MPSTIRGSDNFDSGLDLGVGQGQSWQNVTASRALGTTYTNTTGKPILVNVFIKYGGGGGGNGGNLYVNGIKVATCYETGYTIGFTLSAIVPNGATYMADGILSGYVNSILDTWVELR